MIILAHRGLWRREAEKNSLGALREALTQGFGVETDLRDDRGRVVISHNPPRGDELSFEDFLNVYIASGSIEPLALNVKANGLQGDIKKSLEEFKIKNDRYFLFDMAIPDILPYLRAEMPCFTRESEVEPLPIFIHQASGVWLDCFFKDWINKEVILKHCDAGRRVALVSPELHRRDRSDAWACWKEVYRSLRAQERQSMMMICTDHPTEARAYFDGED